MINGKPVLLDLFCGAGGAAKGYQQAGFHVIGIDINPQPRYVGERFLQCDAGATLERLVDGGLWWIDAIHASPPCQMYSRALKHMAHDQPMLIDAMRELLNKSGLPWVIENVEGSPLPYQSDLFGSHGVMLCGTSFGMRVYRHRLFETSFPVSGPSCAHTTPAMNPHNQAGRDLMYDEFGRGDPEIRWLNEMGVGWMNRHEGRESIPPAFTKHIGDQLMAVVNAKVAA